MDGDFIFFKHITWNACRTHLFHKQDSRDSTGNLDKERLRVTQPVLEPLTNFSPSASLLPQRAMLKLIVSFKLVGYVVACLISEIVRAHLNWLLLSQNCIMVCHMFLLAISAQSTVWSSWL
jgi:hypothetical protein